MANDKPQTPVEALAEELGNVTGQHEARVKAKIDLALSEIARREAEFELRFDRLERRLLEQGSVPTPPARTLTREASAAELPDALHSVPEALRGALGEAILRQRLEWGRVRTEMKADVEDMVAEARGLLADIRASLPKAEPPLGAPPVCDSEGQDAGETVAAV